MSRQHRAPTPARRSRPSLEVPRVPPAYRPRRGQGADPARWVWTGCIALVALVVGVGAWATLTHAPTPAPQIPYTGPIDGIPCDAGTQSGQSFRVHLDIWVGTRAMVVPAGTGTVNTGSGTCQYYLTSPAAPTSASGTSASATTGGGSSNIIAVAAPAGQKFTLGQFFAIWGLPLSASDLMGHQAAGGQSIRAYVNGKAWSGDPAGIPLQPDAEIVLEYGPPWHTPVPATYAFPPQASPAAAPSGTAASSSSSSAPAAASSSAAGGSVPKSSASSSASRSASG